MLRRATVSLFLLAVVGCGQPQLAMDAHKKPDQPAEMKKLEVMVGNWAGTSEMTSPSAEDMKKMMPAGSPEPQTTFKGGGKSEMALGGMALKSEGWHEMGEGQKANYIEYWMWDGKAKKYRTWFASDWGEMGTGWATMCGDNCWCNTFTAQDHAGGKMNGEGQMCMPDKDTMNWSFTMKSSHGKMSMKGVAKRQK